MTIKKYFFLSCSLLAACTSNTPVKDIDRLDQSDPSRPADDISAVRMADSSNTGDQSLATQSDIPSVPPSNSSTDSPKSNADGGELLKEMKSLIPVKPGAVISTLSENRPEVLVDKLPEDEVPGVDENGTLFTWLVKQQSSISDKVTGTAVTIDRWVADDSFVDSMINESYLSVGVGVELGEATDQEPILSVRGKLDLPSSEERYKLFISTLDDDLASLNNQRGPTGAGDSNTQSPLAGLDFYNKSFLGFEPSWRFGARFSSPIDLFARYKLDRSQNFRPNWLYLWQNSAYIYKEKGAGYQSDFDLFHKLNESHFLQSSTSAKFDDTINFWSYFQAFSYNIRANDINNLKWAVGYSSDYDETLYKRQAQPFLRLEWRRRLYKDWLYLYVTPELTFPEQNDFKLEPGLYVELNMLFTKHPETEAENRIKPMPEVFNQPRCIGIDCAEPRELAEK